MFADRSEAGKMLAAKLDHYQGKNPLILAVPRGGVAVAREIWNSLGGELDVVISRKVGVPWQQELAAGAVTSAGNFLLNEKVAQELGLKEEELQAGIKAAVGEIKRRTLLYRGEKPPPDYRGRLIIVVDDGAATGFTIKAALKGIREHNPARLVLALPVLPRETIAILRANTDEMVYLETPEPFYAVGQSYRDFSQLTDREVLALLNIQK